MYQALAYPGESMAACFIHNTRGNSLALKLGIHLDCREVMKLGKLGGKKKCTQFVPKRIFFWKVFLNYFMFGLLSQYKMKHLYVGFTPPPPPKNIHFPGTSDKNLII